MGLPLSTEVSLLVASLQSWVQNYVFSVIFSQSCFVASDVFGNHISIFSTNTVSFQLNSTNNSRHKRESPLNHT